MLSPRKDGIGSPVTPAQARRVLNYVDNCAKVLNKSGAPFSGPVSDLLSSATAHSRRAVDETLLPPARVVALNQAIDT